MKNWLLIAVFCTTAHALCAQPRQEATTLVAEAINIPDTVTISLESIAQYTKEHCATAPTKIRTLFNWVTTHIQYDTDSMYYYNWSKDRASVAATTLRRRKGVCENYAALFTELLVQAGISAWVVTGYTRASGAYSGHSWCAVKLGADWWLCDPTWEVGDNNYTKWLMVYPDDLLKTHMPFDPLWQLRYHPISHKAFRQGNIGEEKGAYCNYPDSIQAFLSLDSLQQLEAFARRMYQAGLENSRLKLWHSYNEMRIAIIYGDKDRELYNAAVDLLNQATGIFNGFVQYRNKQFTPVRTDAAIAQLLEPIAGLITQAGQHLDQMGQVVENFQYDTGAIKERLGQLMAKVQVQQAFIKQYLATAPNKREQLFLQ